MIVRFVDIDGIVDHHCLNFLFIILLKHITKDLYSKKDMNLGRFNIDCI